MTCLCCVTRCRIGRPEEGARGQWFLQSVARLVVYAFSRFSAVISANIIALCCNRNATLSLRSQSLGLSVPPLLLLISHLIIEGRNAVEMDGSREFLMDLAGILDHHRSEKPTALLNRLRKFLPEIATANTNLSSAAECDIEIIAVEDGSDASSLTDSDDESETKAKQPHIVMDVTTVMEDAPIRMVLSDSDSDLNDEAQQILPVGFQTKEPIRKKKRQHFTEEVTEGYMASKVISNDQEKSVESRRMED